MTRVMVSYWFLSLFKLSPGKHSEIFLTFLDVYLAAIFNHKILTIKLFQRHETHIRQRKTELF